MTNMNELFLLTNVIDGILNEFCPINTDKIISLVIGSLAISIVPWAFREWKNCIIYALNNKLCYNVNPFLPFFLRILFWLLWLVWLLSIIQILIFKDNTMSVWGYGLPIAGIILWLCHYLRPYIFGKDRKGLVGLIAHDIKDVNNNGKPNDNEHIHFVYTKRADGKSLSYEERTVIHDEDKIREIVKAIHNYYTELECDINKNANNRALFMIGGKHICEYMREEAYSYNNIKAHIEKVEKTMQDDNSMNFIGDKIGIKGYSIDKGVLTLAIYMTDHFTFMVFKDIFKEKTYKEFFQTIIRRTNTASQKDKKLLVRSLKFLLSSFGIDIVIHGKTCDERKAMLIGVRSGRIEKNGECKLHVPVNETFTRTDIDNKRYSLVECVKRGIEEEIGLESSLIDNHLISFHDFALVSDQGEIGLGCHVDLSSVMPLEQVRLYPGQDKYMENDNLLIVPYPPFFWNPNQYVVYFYKHSYNDIFSIPWESFTPLLYQRCIVRNMSMRYPFLLKTVFILLLTVIIFSIVKPDKVEKNFIKVIVDSIYSVGAAWLWLAACFVFKLLRGNFLKKKTYFMPLIPQWGGDVKVMQSTTCFCKIDNTKAHDDNPTASDFYFCIYGRKEKPREYPLCRLKLIVPPLSKVRRESVYDNRESPINFFMFQPQKHEVVKSRLFFVVVPVRSYDDRIDVDLSISFDSNGNKRFSFTRQLTMNEEPKLYFSEELTSIQCESFQNLYSLPSKTLKKQIKASLPKKFKSRYYPLDLFCYRGNYYWSVLESSMVYAEPRMIEKQTDIYNDFIKDIYENTTIRLTGSDSLVAMKLSEFISNVLNRSRISSLDIYMLQLALLRMGNDRKGIVLGVKRS